MLPLLILGLVLALLIVVFIFQNPGTVIVHFLIWHLTGSLALVIFLTLILGIIICLFIAIPLLIKTHFKTKPQIEKEKTGEPPKQ